MKMNFVSFQKFRLGKSCPKLIIIDMIWLRMTKMNTYNSICDYYIMGTNVSDRRKFEELNIS